ncbi:MAG TPA: hypothetical protein VFP40_00625 [Terriglobales bacterium]|nr:hypothetical protein [Terriglobales bacterium]
MPIVQKGVAAFSDRMPKVISPKQHAIADYITLGGLALMGALFWKRHKRAAIGAIICAGAEATNTMLTDFPGGVAKVISFRTHGKIDMGLAAICSAIPNFFGFDEDAEAKFFRVMGLNITAVGALTDFSEPRAARRLRRIA